MTLSKHLQRIVDREENRIRREIALAVYNAFRANYQITISHDAENETEKQIESGSSFLRTLFNGDSVIPFMFLYQPGEDWKRKEAEPYGWVRFNTGNVQDVVTDFTTNIENRMKQPNELASKYD